MHYCPHGQLDGRWVTVAVVKETACDVRSTLEFALDNESTELISDIC